MAYTGKEAVFQAAAILAGKGLETAVISPGSRNAPLIAAFNRQEGIRCLSIADERVAAFFALGIAQQTQKPVALICTSGTAGLNYAPAVAEAYYQQIPLIIITADRPPEWIDQGDGQAIRQKDLYKNYVRKSVDLPVQVQTEADWRYHARLIHEAFDASCYPVCGPVHINAGLREPLYELDQEPVTAFPDHQLFPVRTGFDPMDIDRLADIWNSTEKKLIIVGQLSPCSRLALLFERLAQDPSVTILTETTSNLSGSFFLQHIDRLIEGLHPAQTKDLAPQLLVTLGGNLVSRKIKAWIHKNRPGAHWHVEAGTFHQDAFRCLTLSIPSSPLDFLRELTPRVRTNDSGYREIWQRHATARSERHLQFMTGCPWSDLKAFEILLQHMPQGSILQGGNSTPIRYLQLFPQADGTNCYGNRGTSGIDGVVSTAAGAAWAYPGLCVVITGDVAFMYDSNALWNQHLTANLRIIVMNNGGGNIFRIIDGPSTMPELDPFIETPYIPDLRHLADMHGLTYLQAEDATSLARVLPEFLHHPYPHPAMLEIKTQNKASAAVLKDYFKHLSS